MKTENRTKFTIRHLVASASLSLLITPIHANAADDLEQSVTLQATVEKTCTFDTPFQSSVTIPIIDGAPDTTPIELTPASITCNTPADIAVTSLSGGIVHEAHRGPFVSPLPDTNYATGIDYAAEITSPSAGSGPLVTLDTSGTEFGQLADSGMQLGFDAASTAPDTQLTLKITPQEIDQNKVLQGGAYEDTLTVVISPK